MGLPPLQKLNDTYLIPVIPMLPTGLVLFDNEAFL